MPNWLRSVDEVLAVLDGAVPELPRLLAAAEGAPLFVVGGTVRDLMLGRGRTDLDVAVTGDVAAVARRLGGEVTEHERFSTAKVNLPGADIDLARTRSESYPEPGALPVVEPAEIIDDLARRDFTVNAMALVLGDDPGLLDPYSGRKDLSEGVLRVLHDSSLQDDPTRALRGARYAARFELCPDADTERLLRSTDLTTISDDRRQAEMRRIAAEPSARQAFTLLAEWGLLDVSPEQLRLAEKAAELLAAPPWSAVADHEETVLAAMAGESATVKRLTAASPSRPSEGVELARGAASAELALARAAGASWLDDYVSEWRSVVLEISGRDLMAEGVPEGPAIGEALGETLRRKLDGEVSGRDTELRTALELSGRESA